MNFLFAEGRPGLGVDDFYDRLDIRFVGDQGEELVEEERAPAGAGLREEGVAGRGGN